jgi:WD40 repeat protein
MHVEGAVRDKQRFIRTFGAIILHSTPHLYISALPLAPTQSGIFRKFAAKFPGTPQVVAGHVQQWSQMEKIIHLYAAVRSLVISRDGKYIVCGSENRTVQVLNMETGDAVAPPLKGHTDQV